MPIRRLPPTLVNKIAAGEVVERPASVVKELVENSLDAGASRIDVSVERGGLDLVRVADNGCGIPAEELELAVAPHATSKIAEEDDLFCIQTLGFRGEALASIASVSQLTLRSRTPQAEHGAMIEVHGGQAGPVAPCGCPVGTIVEVRNLFFNTPVRRKFLRSVQTELGHVTEALVRIALAAPEVHFTLQHGERVLLELPADGDRLERIARCCGRDLADALLYVESREPGLELVGYVSHPNYSRPNNRLQYLFLNGRYIRDRSLQHALGEAYRGLLTVGRFPAAFLFLQVSPETVDVNVHPTKLEVRFQDSGRVYSQVLSALRAKFLSTDMTARVQTTADPSGVMDAQKAAEHRLQVAAWAKGQIAQQAVGPVGAGVAGEADAPPWETDDAASAFPTGGPSPTGMISSDAVFSRAETTRAPSGPMELGTPDQRSSPAGVDRFESGPSQPEGRQPALQTPSPPVRRPTAVQMHHRYLVAETEEGVMIFDQHALHESILYEELRERFRQGRLESQRLLTPEPVDLSPSEAAIVLEHRPVLERLGLVLEPFGGGTVVVLGCPEIGGRVRPAEVVSAVVEKLLQSGRAPDQQELVDELLHTLACRAAVKAGDPLRPEEIEALLARRHAATQAHHCPHGRPTAIVLTRQELDRQFKRT